MNETQAAMEDLAPMIDALLEAGAPTEMRFKQPAGSRWPRSRLRRRAATPPPCGA
jgi:hypothetical protein